MPTENKVGYATEDTAQPSDASARVRAHLALAASKSVATMPGEARCTEMLLPRTCAASDSWGLERGQHAHAQPLMVTAQHGWISGRNDVFVPTTNRLLLLDAIGDC